MHRHIRVLSILNARARCTNAPKHATDQQCIEAHRQPYLSANHKPKLSLSSSTLSKTQDYKTNALPGASCRSVRKKRRDHKGRKREGKRFNRGERAAHGGRGIWGAWLVESRTPTGRRWPAELSQITDILPGQANPQLIPASGPGPPRYSVRDFTPLFLSKKAAGWKDQTGL